MTIDVRPCRVEEVRLFLETSEAAFGDETNDNEVERVKKVLGPERMHAAFEDDVMVGTTGSFPFSLTIPGGELPAGGITMVGVLTSHRRRGVLSKLMRTQLEEHHRWGEPLAVLWASEAAIYWRFGYGLATKQGEIDIERERAVFLDGAEAVGRTRLLSVDEAGKVLPEIYDRIRTVTPGMFARSPEWWQVETLADPEEHRRGGGPMFRVVWEHEGRAEAYALYRVHGTWEESMPSGWLEVIEVMATGPLATREIWRLLFGVDLTARVKSWFQPLDTPLFSMLTEPRRLRFKVKDALWLRIVDVDRALEARSYAAGGSLVFDLSDRLCPWNAGRWRLDASSGGGRLQRTDDPPELELSVAELGAVYLGGSSFGELARAGRITERVPGAALRASVLLSTERAPFCPEIF